MVVRTADLERTEDLRPSLLPVAFPASFGALLRTLRVRSGLSQNALARVAGVDPAYVNRLERETRPDRTLPSRRVVLAFWSALAANGAAITPPIGLDDRERLLCAAGLVPEAILVAGGWDAYVGRLRGEVQAGLTSMLHRFEAALAPAGE